MKSNEVERLIECPFCESNVVATMPIVRFDENKKQYDRWYVYCKDCDARCGEEITKEDAVARWNRDFEYFMKKDGVPNLFTVKFIAFTDGYYGYTGEKQYDFEAETLEDARHWVINHLDCSCEWNVREL